MSSQFSAKDVGQMREIAKAVYENPTLLADFERDPEGQKIEGTGGILPDIAVKQSPKWHAEDFKDKVNDVQLQTALDFLRSRLNGKSVAEAREQLQIVR